MNLFRALLRARPPRVVVGAAVDAHEQIAAAERHGVKMRGWAAGVKPRRGRGFGNIAKFAMRRSRDKLRLGRKGPCDLRRFL